jgi:hypothetical protein
MTEIRTRETSHGGKSVDISKAGEIAYKPPKIPKSQPPAQSQPKVEKISVPKVEEPPKPNQKNVTDKAKNVTRVANRLGWVSTEDPDEAIKSLTKEAEKMNENVYKYLESLAKLGRNYCFKENPKCINCPMNQGCKFRAANGFVKKGLFRR